MLRKVPMRMFSSLTERINVLREPKQTPDVLLVSGRHDGLQHGVSIQNPIIFSETFCRITRVRNTAHPRNFWHVVYLLLFYDISIS